MITIDRLKELLHYDPISGVFIRLKNFGRWGRISAGSIATVDRGDGYLTIMIEGRRYYAHRLAYFYMTGIFPEKDIDHVDGNQSNNAFANLRDVSHQANVANRTSAQANSKIGLLGVQEDSRCPGFFSARIKMGGKQRYLGSFSNAAEAHAAYTAARIIRDAYLQ